MSRPLRAHERSIPLTALGAQYVTVDVTVELDAADVNDASEATDPMNGAGLVCDIVSCMRTFSSRPTKRMGNGLREAASQREDPFGSRTESRANQPSSSSSPSTSFTLGSFLISRREIFQAR